MKLSGSCSLWELARGRDRVDVMPASEPKVGSSTTWTPNWSSRKSGLLPEVMGALGKIEGWRYLIYKVPSQGTDSDYYKRTCFFPTGQRGFRIPSKKNKYR